MKKKITGIARREVLKVKKLNENRQSNFVTDATGAKVLNVSVNTFRRIAADAGAVYFFGRSRRTDMNKVRQSLDLYRAE